MELYRYLFAPVLLAVAVWSGHHQKRPVPTPERPAAVEVAPVLRPAVDRRAPVHRADVPVPTPAPARRDLGR